MVTEDDWFPRMIEELIRIGEINVEGRLVDASNATLFVTITHEDREMKAIYKPIAGERPLWDFPDGNLASRERAAYLISEALKVHCVPLTVLRDGPFGVGAVQEWIEIDEEIDLEDYFRQDLPQLRLVALFDALINNTDRKIGHLLPRVDGKLLVCDHGVTFHVEDKLRTVLWQWSGQPLTVEERASIEELLRTIESQEINELSDLLTVTEIAALVERCKSILVSNRFPEPNPNWPHIPWPPF
jgi:uncharacterized repeat protein (TIGR03843 family)